MWASESKAYGVPPSTHDHKSRVSNLPLRSLEAVERSCRYHNRYGVLPVEYTNDRDP
jgi:hypothetical protein